VRESGHHDTLRLCSNGQTIEFSPFWDYDAATSAP